jgi:hypothetical protein
MAIVLGGVFDYDIMPFNGWLQQSSAAIGNAAPILMFISPSMGLAIILAAHRNRYGSLAAALAGLTLVSLLLAFP